MKPPNNGSENLYPVYVGPYKIGKTLGQGQTGVVKLGSHCKTKEKVAIKIINKQKLKPSVLQKVEREIAIMRLIEHPHVLGLYDVYESSRYLYLVLEHVSGGELFDYLVKKGRLKHDEARHFFRQIISAVDFCHRHGVCHRDLKPENLLLDEYKNLKVADFGMASIQLENSLLETSCGSPHYACPEVIKGGPYDGKRADVWSSGIILYALLVGSLPFDHQDMARLLERVRLGKYSTPSWIPSDAKDLISQMLQVNPEKRINLQQVFKHPFMSNHEDKEKENTYLTPIETVLYTQPLDTKQDIDKDIVKQMSSLGCFKNNTNLVDSLVDKKHNMEKVVYFLLLDRKRRQPALKDNIPLRKRWKNRASSKEMPTKRVDSVKLSPTTSPAVSPNLSSHRSLCKAMSLGNETLPHLSPKPCQNRRLSLCNTLQDPTRLHSITEIDNKACPRYSVLRPSSCNRSLETLSSHKRDMSLGKDLSLSRDMSRSSAGLVTANSQDREDDNSLLKSMFPWKHRNKETYIVLRGTTLVDFNTDILSLFNTYKVTQCDIEGGYSCKYNNSKKGLLSKTVKFYLTAEERSVSLTQADTIICVCITYKSGSTKKFKRLCEIFQRSLNRPNTGRPFSPVLRKVCSYFSSESKLTSDTDSHGSFDMLGSNCSDPSF